MRNLLLSVFVLLAACSGEGVVDPSACTGAKPSPGDHALTSGVYSYQSAWPSGTMVGDMVLSRVTTDSIFGYVDLVIPGQPTRRVQFVRHDASGAVLCLSGQWVDQASYNVALNFTPPGLSTSGLMLHSMSRGLSLTDVRCSAEFRPTEAFPGQKVDTVHASSCSIVWKRGAP